MKTYLKTLSIFVLTIVSLPVFAQQLQGTVIDKAANKGVATVTVVNKRTQATTQTGTKGIFNIAAQEGDTLLFSHPAYAFVTTVVSNRNPKIYLSERVHQLRSVEVLSPMAKYREDSISYRQTYRKVLADAERTPEAYNIGCQGCFTALAAAIGGQKKEAKEFAESFEYFEGQKFINVRYTEALVTEVTGLKGEAAKSFIATNPMDYTFARSASDVEIKMWIRDKYKASKKRSAGRVSY